LKTVRSLFPPVLLAGFGLLACTWFHNISLSLFLVSASGTAEAEV
jgi:hypothetical protein